MLIPIVSIVGKSNSGKTTLVEKLIAQLTARGYRVGTVKHNLHGFEIDHAGKDSWRHKKAGARLTVICCPSKIALIEDADHDYSLAEIRAKYVHDVDLILSEGYKDTVFPRIEVFRAELKREVLSQPDDNLLALAADSKLDIGVPCYDLNDAPGLADLIESTFLKDHS